VAESEKCTKAQLLLLETGSGKIARRFNLFDREPTQHLASVQFSSDGKQLAAVVHEYRKSQDAKGSGYQPASVVVRRWEMGTNKELPPIEAGPDAVVVFSSDLRTLAIGLDESVELRDTATNRTMHRLQGSEPVHRFQFMGRHLIGDRLAFSPDGTRLALAAGHTVRQFEVATGKEIGPAPISLTLHSLSAARDGRWLVAGTLGHVDVWDGRANSLAFRVPPWSAVGKGEVSFTAAVLADDGSRLAVAASDGVVALFDVPSGKKLRQMTFHTAPVTSLAFMP
jgi:WD40 repeat protein